MEHYGPLINSWTMRHGTKLSCVKQASQHKTSRTMLRLLRRTIFEACIIPILLYGCETWLLGATSIKMLESVQREIGRHQLVHSIDD